jgi:ribosome-associated protein
MHDEHQTEPVSKTRRKKESHALQDLGETLVKLSAQQLARMALPENLLQAVREAQRISKHEARRRQMQYIGRLMRDIDAAPIREAIDELEGRSAHAIAAHHELERLREELLENEDTLGRIAQRFPGADLQQLRTLRRNALREQELARPPRAFRELFQVLKALQGAPAQAGHDDTSDGIEAHERQ